jgi:hypothetical protein
VAGHCCATHGYLARDALMLITSELVTNAVLYGSPPITVQLCCHVTEVRLTVGDTGTWHPEGQGPSKGLGTGLRIVAGIAKEWGTTPLADGKEVWCRVPTGVVPLQRTAETPAQLAVERAVGPRPGGTGRVR